MRGEEDAEEPAWKLSTSNFTWRAGGAFPVAVTYRWLDAQGRVVAGGAAAALPQDVMVGTNVTLSVPVRAPYQTGIYALQWELVEGATPSPLLGAHRTGHRQHLRNCAQERGGSAARAVIPPRAVLLAHTRIVYLASA